MKQILRALPEDELSEQARLTTRSALETFLNYVVTQKGRRGGKYEVAGWATPTFPYPGIRVEKGAFLTLNVQRGQNQDLYHFARWKGDREDGMLAEGILIGVPETGPFIGTPKDDSILLLHRIRKHIPKDPFNQFFLGFVRVHQLPYVEIWGVNQLESTRHIAGTPQGAVWSPTAAGLEEQAESEAVIDARAQVHTAESQLMEAQTRGTASEVEVFQLELLNAQSRLSRLLAESRPSVPTADEAAGEEKLKPLSLASTKAVEIEALLPEQEELGKAVTAMNTSVPAEPKSVVPRNGGPDSGPIAITTGLEEIQRALISLDELNHIWEAPEVGPGLTARPILADATDDARVRHLAQALSVMMAKDNVPELDFRLVIPTQLVPQLMSEMDGIGNPKATDGFLASRIISYDGRTKTREEARLEALNALARRFGYGSTGELLGAKVLQDVQQLTQQMALELRAFFEAGGLRFASGEVFERLKAVLEAA